MNFTFLTDVLNELNDSKPDKYKSFLSTYEETASTEQPSIISNRFTEKPIKHFSLHSENLDIGLYLIVPKVVQFRYTQSKFFKMVPYSLENNDFTHIRELLYSKYKSLYYLELAKDDSNNEYLYAHTNNGIYCFQAFQSDITYSIILSEFNTDNKLIKYKPKLEIIQSDISIALAHTPLQGLSVFRINEYLTCSLCNSNSIRQPNIDYLHSQDYKFIEDFMIDFINTLVDADIASIRFLYGTDLFYISFDRTLFLKLFKNYDINKILKLSEINSTIKSLYLQNKSVI